MPSFTGILQCLNHSPFVTESSKVVLVAPFYFCLCLDGLLTRMRDAGIGCFLGNTFVGALAYADDLTIIAPKADAARKMLDICDKYASTYSMNFNANKSKCIFFSTRQ